MSFPCGNNGTGSPLGNLVIINDSLPYGHGPGADFGDYFAIWAYFFAFSRSPIASYDFDR
jgi:hypothetical protein